MTGVDPLTPAGRVDPRPTRAPATRPRLRAALPVTGLVVALALLPGCAQAEEAARTAAESAAREAVAEATAAAGAAGEDVAREEARQAVDSVLDTLPGTCTDVLEQPAGVREQQAEAVLRSYWLGELAEEAPPAETVEAFEEAVVEHCQDSRETQAADVIREVWQTGSFAP